MSHRGAGPLIVASAEISIPKFHHGGYIMTAVQSVEVDYFSDVLCVWAYCGDVRIAYLKDQFGDQVVIRSHYFSLFGDAHGRIGGLWAERGGLPGFGAHVAEVCGQWDHIAPAHDGLWREVQPTTSIMAHVTLKAAQLHETKKSPGAATPRSDALAQRVREAFFAQGQDISDLTVLRRLAQDNGQDWAKVAAYIEDGRAHAALHSDELEKERLQISGSPTLVMNDGRQKIYGNVGYKVMEANVAELLSNPKSGDASWC